MSRRQASRRGGTGRKRTRRKRARDMSALVGRFPVKQDPSLLPPTETELWDAVAETPVVRRRA
jgi:hypothetical protein